MTTYVHDHSNIEVTRHINVIDGEVRPQPYSSAGRKYRVSKVIVEFRWAPIPTGWKVSGANLSGTVLKADGSDSKNDAREHVSTYDTPPMWLDELIDAVRPVGAVELPFDVPQNSNGS